MPIIRRTPASSRMTEPLSPSLPDIPFQAVVEHSVAGIYVLQDERFVYANAHWAGIVGLTPEEMVGGHLSRFVPPEELDALLDKYHRRLRGDPPSMHFVTRGLHRDGSIRLIEVHGSRMVYRGRPAVMGVGIDVTERLHNEAELRRSREQLQALTTYTAAKLEEQRLSLARDVHDVLGGMLTAIKMDATRLLRRTNDAEAHGIAEGLLGLTQATLETVRRIAEELRPAVLDHLDISAAIARELQAFSQRFGIAHALDAPADTRRLTPRRTTAVYRIFHEALTNVARHAQAAKVEVRVAIEGEVLALDLRDDGCGFDPAAQEGRRALGLLSMRERAREVGGSLQIESAPGAGTRLQLRVPLV